MLVHLCTRSLIGLAFLLGSAAWAADWGDLKGRFVYDGQPPERKPLTITADKEFCGNKNILEEHLVVNPANKGVANVIVWLYLGRGDGPPPLHVSYAATEKADVHLDANGCRFDPHVCLLRTSQTLVLRNRNPIGDSAKIDTLSNPPINIILPIGFEVRQKYTAEERLPARVSCSVHPWESGWLMVKEHPYMAVSNENGEFKIANLPAGKWTFQFWQEHSGYVSQVNVAGKSTKWARGRVELKIQPGDNDLGELFLTPDLFAN